MLNSEKDWTRARRIGWVWGAFGLALLIGHGWAVEAFDLDPILLKGLAGGLIGGVLMGELWLYGKPRTPPSASEIDKLDRRNLPVMLISTICTWTMLGSFLVVTQFDLSETVYWTLTIIAAVSLLGALLALPSLIAHMRASRIAPELFDERSKCNLDRAYRHGFLLMFQTAFLGGVLLMLDIIHLPAEFAMMLVGLIGISAVSVLWCWYEWRDTRAIGTAGADG